MAVFNKDADKALEFLIVLALFHLLAHVLLYVLVDGVWFYKSTHNDLQDVKDALADLAEAQEPDPVVN